MFKPAIPTPELSARRARDTRAGSPVLFHTWLFCERRDGLAVVFLARVFLVRGLEQPSFMFAVWSCVEALRAQVSSSAGCVHGPGLLSVMFAPTLVKDALLKHAAVYREQLCRAEWRGVLLH